MTRRGSVTWGESGEFKAHSLQSTANSQELWTVDCQLSTVGSEWAKTNQPRRKRYAQAGVSRG